MKGINRDYDGAEHGLDLEQLLDVVNHSRLVEP